MEASADWRGWFVHKAEWRSRGTDANRGERAASGPARRRRGGWITGSRREQETVLERVWNGATKRCRSHENEGRLKCKLNGTSREPTRCRRVDQPGGWLVEESLSAENTWQSRNSSSPLSSSWPGARVTGDTWRLTRRRRLFFFFCCRRGASRVCRAVNSTVRAIELNVTLASLNIRTSRPALISPPAFASILYHLASSASERRPNRARVESVEDRARLVLEPISGARHIARRSVRSPLPRPLITPHQGSRSLLTL